MSPPPSRSEGDGPADAGASSPDPLADWVPDPLLAGLQLATAFLAFWGASFLVQIACVLAA